MNEINRLADFILKYYGQEIGLGNPIEGESAVDVAIRLLTPQSSPSVTDLLANLARRVSSLEQQLSDTQGNVEKLAEELAGTNNVARKALTATGNHGGWLIRNAERFDKIEELLESNEQDIAMLDERTQPKETTTPPLLFVQNSVGNNFTLYQEGKKVHGIRSVRINASYDDVTTHEVEYVTGATDGGVRR
jgi:hypothetical protein